MTLLYRYCRPTSSSSSSDCSSDRGRHLVAVQNLSVAQLIFVERPLLCLQTLENQKYNRICSHCKAFIGGPDHTLLFRCRENHTTTIPLQEDDDHEDEDGFNRQTIIIPCRKACGHGFCSQECEHDGWNMYHQYLCTGKCDTHDHPLVLFKQFCVETNEIFLLVAEWWITQHVVAASIRNNNNNHNNNNDKSDCSTDQQEDDEDENNDPDPYTDFLMNPWWDVVTTDLQQQPGGFTEAAILQRQLQQLCQQAADLFNQAMMSMESDHKQETQQNAMMIKIMIPPISAYKIAIRIGACEQNAMGIRQRSPLCRDIFDPSFRRRRHAEIIHCLEESGFIGDNEENDDNSNDGDNDDDDDKTPKIDDSTTQTKENQSSTDRKEVESPNNNDDDGEEEEEVWDYSVEEIASFLANLYMDEDGSQRDLQSLSLKKKDRQQLKETNNRNDVGDDLDKLFPPLDGTAMYSRICKMNHSCNPNVVVVYPRCAGWGSQHPLTAFCVAIKEIRAGDELTISYVDPELNYQDRQAALANYGFRCQCNKCIMEEMNDNNSITNLEAGKYPTEEELFGSDSENEEEGEESVVDNFVSLGDDGELKLQDRLEILDTLSNQANIGAIPLCCLGPLSAFLLQTSKSCLSSEHEWKHEHLPKLVKQCVEGMQERDYVLCKIVGSDLEQSLFGILKRDGKWPSVSYREAYWCAAITVAVAHAHDFHFLQALFFIDKGIILGLPRDDDNRVEKFIDYVESNASSMYTGPYPLFYSQLILPDYREERWSLVFASEGLSKSLQYPVEESQHTLKIANFEAEYLGKSKPVVVRSFAANWPATRKWRRLDYFSRRHGHRLVPVECGSMMAFNMKEELMQLRHFVDQFLVQSGGKPCWGLQDCLKCVQQVAYVAQHPLITQVSSLQDDVKMFPDLCGPAGPRKIYLWMGTGGTRTPLHFDSYDNIFVQLVGSKYIRLYGHEETPKLYVSKKTQFGLQGNMSDLDCEREDFVKHPLAKTARYTEVLLNPGDLLLIPSKTWHYVRSLTTSISINYWL